MGMLDNKVAIVTGATSGIGKRTAELFVTEGAAVVFTGRRKVEGEAIAQRLGKGASYVAADATSEADWQRVTSFAMKHHGRIDALFNKPEAQRRRAASRTSPLMDLTMQWLFWCAR